jgi:catechol 2,3-dioxygenase-like lactoylglutathione lyase family enzyme
MEMATTLLAAVVDQGLGQGSAVGSVAGIPVEDLESISAVTLVTHVMARSVEFYTSLGFEPRYGGPEAGFSSFAVGNGYLNLIAQPAERPLSWWGQVILYVSDVDAVYDHALRLGLSPQAPSRDGVWGERYFHLTDPDGHEISFARPLRRGAVPVRGDSPEGGLPWRGGPVAPPGSPAYSV